MKINKPTYKLCIVGSGPSGCYLAKSLLRYSNKENILINIDMIDSLDKPYGLIRYGIAPDNYKFKSLMNTFDRSLFRKYSDKIKFIGNTTVGHDIYIDELRKIYDILILAVGGSQSFNTLKIKHLEEKLLNKVIGGIFSSRDWVLYYNNHPKFRNMLNLSDKIEKNIMELNNSDLNMDFELSYLKKKCPLYFEHKNPIISENEQILENQNKELNYGYTSNILKSYIINSKERNAVIIGNGNVALDIARLLSFYSHNQLSKNKLINDDYLNLLNISNNKNPRLNHSLFKNIYIIGRRGWINNSFKYSLLKEFLEKSRNFNLNKSYHDPNIRIMMPKEDYELSQDPASISNIEKSGSEVKRKYLKMKKIFEEMVNNHEDYIHNNMNIFHNNNTVNIYFMNLRSPINISTEDIKFKSNQNSKNLTTIPFIKSIELTRNISNSEFENKFIFKQNFNMHLPCQLLITSLGFKPNLRQVYKKHDIQTSTNSYLCPVFKTGWMDTNSKGDLSVAYQNSLYLSHKIISLLKKITPKNSNT